MDISMESNEPSPESVSITKDDILFENQQLSVLDSNATLNADLLMPPPPGPPGASPFRLTQSLANFSFVSPSKEDEVPMEFSPAVKRRFEKGYSASESPRACESSSPSSDLGATNKTDVQNENIQNEGSVQTSSGQTGPCKSAEKVGSDMHPAEVFTTSPGSPSSQFKAMMDAIDVKESPSWGKDDDFLKRQEKPNLRRCRSLEMRKRLFDMSNTPPNAFKPVFKRPAAVDTDEQTYTKLAKRPKDILLGSIKETSAGSLECLLDKGGDSAKGVSQLSSSERDSEDHQRIKVAVDALQSPDMVGDSSREHCLPVICGKHSDLKNISHDTMAHLLTDGPEGKFDKLTVIDCRYPYEYEGGHIKNAVNFYTEDHIEKFLQREVLEVTGKKTYNHILVFHCEFSSQRGPGLLRYLRKQDRKMNMHQYPLLTFPEIYVLHLGYKEFFANHPHLCVPPAYIPMADESFVEDLKHFRAKAKSWTAGEKSRSSKR